MIKDWIKEYNPKNEEEILSALREIMQEVTLAGLSRTDFFEKAAFYGGTALRIFYGLDRFSEDLDFSRRSKCSFLSTSLLFCNSPLAPIIKSLGAVMYKLKSPKLRVNSPRPTNCLFCHPDTSLYAHILG
jgi:hypothetical protein